jgi:hypothetical protein
VSTEQSISTTERRDQRTLDMAEKYQAGATLQEIGDYYGLTRERVRQIMTRGLGVTRKDGGRAARSLAKKSAVEVRRNQKFIARYGMSETEFRRAQQNVDRLGNTPRKSYLRQLHNAKKRGIRWVFTFAEWWDIWEKSGKWTERGRGHGYCMARHGDRGAYAIGNVKIIPATENQREYIRRFWKQVRNGERSAPRGSSRFTRLLVGQTLALPITQKRPSYARESAYAYAREHDWKVSTSIRDGVLTVTRTE